MEQILININSKYTTAFLNFLKTLSYIEIKKVGKIEENPNSETTKNDLLATITGAWKDDKTAEEIIEEMRQSRHFSRTVEGL